MAPPPEYKSGRFANISDPVSASECVGTNEDPRHNGRFASALLTAMLIATLITAVALVRISFYDSLRPTI